jgi:hypothetical protein
VETPDVLVEPTRLEAVVELADELVEQVSLGLVVPVSGGAAGIEVSAGAGRGAQRSQHQEQPPAQRRGTHPY